MDAVMPGVLCTPLKRIVHPKGDIYHAMKCSDAGFEGFGEAYFTTVLCGETKGWKRHTRMQMNLVVPVGTVKFHIRNDRGGDTVTVDLGEENYARLTVAPGLWMAFSGVGKGMNLILNLASIEHNPAEAVNVPLDTYPLG